MRSIIDLLNPFVIVKITIKLSMLHQNNILGFALSDHMIRNGNKLMMKARATFMGLYATR